jgi:hypothetical protein
VNLTWPSAILSYIGEDVFIYPTPNPAGGGLARLFGEEVEADRVDNKTIL